MPTETCNRVRVERYFLGEGGSEERRAIRAHLDGCAECRGLLHTFENDRREYLLAHPFRDFAAQRLPAEGPRRRPALGSRWMPAIAGLAICLILLPVLLRTGLQTRIVDDSGIRAKGGALMEYYVKRGDAVTPGNPADPYRPGDELQFVCSAGGYAYVTLASIDSRGHVSLYRAPLDTNATPGTEAALSLPGKGGEKQPLPYAVTLDDSPGSELFVMIFGAVSLSGEAVDGWLTEAYTRASGNLEAIPSLLTPPPGSEGKARATYKTLLLRKAQT